MTDWFDQTRVLTETVAEAQAKMWEAWMDAASAFMVAPGASGPGTSDPGASGDAAAAEAPWNPASWPAAWQDLGRMTMEVWTRGSSGVPRSVADRLFAGQEAYLRFVDFALSSLRVVAPKIDTGEDWIELLRRYLEQVKQGMVDGSAWLSPEGLTAVAASGPELWSLYQTELSRFLGPWAGFMQRLPMEMSEIAAGDRAAASRLQLDFTDTFETAFGRYLAAPALGFYRELQEKTFRGFEAWSDYRRASMEFQDEFLNTGVAAYEGLMRELVDRGERGEAITSFRELFDLWIDMGERAYADLFSSEGFSNVQGRMVNAAMVYQLRQREVLEEMQNLLNLPTRSEIDQVHRHVYDLRVEVRYMKREMASLRKALEGKTTTADATSTAGSSKPSSPTPDAKPATPKTSSRKAPAAKSGTAKRTPRKKKSSAASSGD